MKKLFITLCGVAVLAGLSNFAYAEGKGCPTDKFSPEMKGKMHQNFTPEQREQMKAKMQQKKAEFEARLKLTPTQKEKMKAIHESAKCKIQPLFENMKTERTKLKQLKESGASQQEIQAQKAKTLKIREQIKAVRKSNFEQIQAILTPEQQKEFNKMHEEHKKNMNEHKNDFKNKFEEKE
ncbi:MAG TPA: hypothetical protein DDW90_08285 [Cyanobacteria bacterium UBA9971]|nr:hypothetical protein [Cyanobacteria bacterium UBA9971]